MKWTKNEQNEYCKGNYKIFKKGSVDAFGTWRLVTVDDQWIEDFKTLRDAKLYVSQNETN